MDLGEVHDKTTKYGEAKDFIHMGEGNTGENNQGLGMTSDQEHKRKGKWPETRGELPFKIKHEFHKTKNPRQDKPHRDVTRKELTESPSATDSGAFPFFAKC